MAESFDEILNPGEESVVDESVAEVLEDDESTGEDESQVAAEEITEVEQPSIKSELSALSKERERIRQKEAVLDEELSRLRSSAVVSDTATKSSKGTPTLKELKAKHRAVLVEMLLDPDNADAAQRFDALEDSIEDVRTATLMQQQRNLSAAEDGQARFHTTLQSIYEQYPFLHTDHPEVNAELNEDINAYYYGRLQQGDDAVSAIRKAVDKFVPVKAAAEKKVAKPLDNGREMLLGKTGFSEVRSAGATRTSKPFTGMTPMTSILARKT
jgi:hypothetical protein